MWPGFSVRCLVLALDVWFPRGNADYSSTFKESLAVKFVLLSLVNQLSGLTVKWFTDNQSVPRIISSGR